jgi:hypothetical protein
VGGLAGGVGGVEVGGGVVVGGVVVGGVVVGGVEPPPPPPPPPDVPPVMATPKTVPVSWAMVGLDVELRVITSHGGAPVVTLCGDTVSHAPAPLFAAGFHHSMALPSERLQSVMATLVKSLKLETLTSK